ncbi:MAG TPA: glycosyltransferase family 4 protein [Polyangiaceae bacterium]|nr:glycosyltransferase family 4 protein [Polyangiaceae bacterium]
MTGPSRPREHVFVCPPLDGPVTGGTLYNRELYRALAARGVAVRALSLGEALGAPFEAAWPVPRDGSARVWIDSLYMEHAPALRRATGAADAGSIGLVVHYLPSLVALGRAPSRGELSVVERDALDSVGCFLATSAFMRDVLLGAGVSAARVVVIVPGLDWIGEPFTPPAGADTGGAIPLSGERTRREGPLSALMIANQVSGKGIVPFLRALDAALDDEAALRLSIVGSAALDDGYARECRGAVAAGSRVRRCVRLEGPLSRRALLELLEGADVLVSASRMESFGMALAEARALGVPILALAGGNTASLVDADSGGELFSDDASLARALVRLGRDREELDARARRARRRRLRRTWDAAAAEFVAARFESRAP